MCSFFLVSFYESRAIKYIFFYEKLFVYIFIKSTILRASLTSLVDIFRLLLRNYNTWLWLCRRSMLFLAGQCFFYQSNCQSYQRRHACKISYTCVQISIFYKNWSLIVCLIFKSVECLDRQPWQNHTPYSILSNIQSENSTTKQFRKPQTN